MPRVSILTSVGSLGILSFQRPVADLDEVGISSKAEGQLFVGVTTRPPMQTRRRIKSKIAASILEYTVNASGVLLAGDGYPQPDTRFDAFVGNRCLCVTWDGFWRVRGCVAKPAGFYLNTRCS